MMAELHQLADFISGLTFEALPAAVVDRAQWVIRDTVGAVIGGMQEPEVAALAGYAAQNHPGAATLWGSGGRATPAWAALVHGTAGTTLEMDEGHAFARGHAAVHAVPTALALAEAAGASGREAVTAVVVGYEVAARAGVATRLRLSVHPFGAWGVLGAAAVAGWFKGMSGAQLAGALELAASYAITPSFETAYQGANVRNTFAGVINRAGLLAADFYELGFRGETGGLQTVFGEILGRTFDPAALVDGLGERYEIMRGYFKPYSACRYTHAAVDAALALRAAGAVDPAQIEYIDVATYDIAAHLTDPAPQTPLAGRFSLPYVVAATLITGGAGPEIFTPEKLGDESILALARRVRVVEDPAFTALTPARRPARVVIVMVDGRRREQTVMGSKGDPDQPMTAAELEAKFMGLVTAVLGPIPAQQAWQRLGQLVAEPSLDLLTTLLTIGMR
ncbi:MAG TPA: MmgE/PrpD family protein [Anaerolineae bacterium]|nr:MmgE/PrpD family protein [Anaerolineae bacterium]